jgi:hypothetical protein
MKIRSAVLFGLVLLLGIAIGYLYHRDNADDNYWKKRISHYQDVSDSLGAIVQGIDTRLQKKDSMLLLYIASLDKTLEELNKETNKNKQIIKDNFSKQDSILSEYCRQMAGLDQKPDICK